MPIQQFFRQMQLVIYKGSSLNEVPYWIIEIQHVIYNNMIENKDLPFLLDFFLKLKHTGRGVVLAKKQFSPTVSISASARKFSSDFSPIIKGRRSNPPY